MMTALLLAPFVVAASPTLCASIQAGDLPAVQKQLQGKRALPTCPWPPEFLAVAGARNEAGLAMLDLVVSKGGKVGITSSGVSLLASAKSAEVVRGLLKRGVTCQPTDLAQLTDQEWGFDVGAATAMVEAGCPIEGALVGAARSGPLTKLLLERGANARLRQDAAQGRLHHGDGHRDLGVRRVPGERHAVARASLLPPGPVHPGRRPRGRRPGSAELINAPLTPREATACPAPRRAPVD